MSIVTIEEMKELERVLSTEYRFTDQLIIENVGLQGADYLCKEILQGNTFREVVVFVGKGNNGADGLAIARHLKVKGYSTRAFLLFPDDETSKEFQTSLDLAVTFGVRVSEVRSVAQVESYFRETQSEFFVVDAIFGTGIRFPISSFMADIFHLINEWSTRLVSIDIPSGVDGNSGMTDGVGIKAQATLAIGLAKVGHFVGEGARLKGKLEVIHAGIPIELRKAGETTLLELSHLGNILRRRDKFAHKNIFGHALVIGGSKGLTGANVLCSWAALRCGTGLLTSATWSDAYSELMSRQIPEVMGTEIHSRLVEVAKERYDSVVIGPGLGRGRETREVVLDFLRNYPGPLVLDADALNVFTLSEDKEIFEKRTNVTILTPHLGEFSRFMEVDKEAVLKSPLKYLKKCVEVLNCEVVLKGPCTYMGHTSGSVTFHDFPNDGMATGGTGDVLAGILGGLLAQFARGGMSAEEKEKIAEETVCLGVGIHSLSGKIAAKELGVRAMTAGGLIKYLPKAFKEIRKSQRIQVKGVS